MNNTTIHADVGCDHEILGSIWRPVGFGDLVALNKHSLVDSTVFNLRLVDEGRAVIEMVENDKLSHPEVFTWVVMDGLLKVGVKPKNLTIMLDPCRRLNRNTFVWRCLYGAVILTVCLRRRTGPVQLLDDIARDIFIRLESPFGHVTASLHPKDLRLVEACLFGVGKLVSREERHLKVGVFHNVYYYENPW
jgi:hypothetical protein